MILIVKPTPALIPPRFTRIYRAAGAAAGLTLLLSACGQPGPLYIPKGARPVHSQSQVPGQETPTPTPPIPNTLPPSQ